MKYKEFQRAAIQKIIRGYESGEKNNRFLVADEVGLGKTIVAKGTIRCLCYFKYLEWMKSKGACSINSEDSKSDRADKFEFNVLYLCSNLNIAEQNKSKLGVAKCDRANLLEEVLCGTKSYGEYRGNHNEGGSSVENRTTMLLKKMLKNDSQNAPKAVNNGKSKQSQLHFQEITVGELRKACMEIYGEEALEKREVREGRNIVANRDEEKIRLNIIPITTKTSIEIKGKGHQVEREFILNIRNRIKSFQENISGNSCEDDVILKTFADKLAYVQRKHPELQNKKMFLEVLEGKEVTLLKEQQEEEWQKLRQQFALASVEMLKYDFVIMDEFQNFSEILNKANETEAAKKSYVGKAGYIYAALKASGKHEALADRLKENYISKTVDNVESVKLTEIDRIFWKDKLENVTFDAGIDIDELIQKFTELAADRLNYMDGENVPSQTSDCSSKEESKSDKLKKVSLELVKNVISRENGSDVNADYLFLSKDTIGFKWGEIEEIGLINENTNEPYKKSSVEIYRDEALRNNTNLLQWWDTLGFEWRYERLRRCGNINWRSTPKKQVPFRYLLNLHYATKGKNIKTDTDISNLILNCFIYFCEDIETKIYLWQYAYLLTKCLAKNDKYPGYTVEQLEPLRNMLGTHIRKAESSQDWDKKCENIVIEKIFQNEYREGKYTRILMLSATPFRMYITEGNEAENNDGSNANIMEVCDFLDTNSQTNLGRKLVSYKEELLRFAQGQKKTENFGNDMCDVIEKKEKFQEAMNNVFTRMERYAVLRELVDDWFTQQAKSDTDDELACGKINELFTYLKQAEHIKELYEAKRKEKQEKKGLGSSIIYAEDAPYMATFMHGIAKTQKSNSQSDRKNVQKDQSQDNSSQKVDEGDGYKWKRAFDGMVKEKEVEFEEDSYLYLTKKRFDQKNKPLGLWHGVYEAALLKILELDSAFMENRIAKGDMKVRENHPGAARLLWVPSCASVKKGKLKGAFVEHPDYGKTIIFSRLVQVPRMIAGLLEYEVLRRLSWLIEEKCGVDVIHKVLDSLGIENAEDNSTYQKLDKILEKSMKNLEELLLAEKIDDIRTGDKEEPKSIKEICKVALERYCDKYITKLHEENGRNDCNEEIDEIKTYIGKPSEKKTLNSGKLDILANSLAKNLVRKVLLNRQQGMFAIWASEGFWDGEPKLTNAVDIKKAFLEDCKKKVLQYCQNGCLSDVLDEWLYICLDGEQDLGECLGVSVESTKADEKVDCLSFIRTTQLSVSLYEDDGEGKVKNSAVQSHDSQEGNENREQQGEKIDTFFARCVGMSKDDDKVSSIKGLQQSFNAPFAPFVFATTSMGQEGLDFHHYADKIIHWRLPSNPVDFEQREGRINRYHCLALRKKLLEWYGDDLQNKSDVYDIFRKAFENATNILLQESNAPSEKPTNPIVQCGLVPDWVLLSPPKQGEERKSVSIKRFVPYFYLSRTNEDFHRNLKVLQLYRSVIGQTNPEEVMERLMTHRTPEEVEKLFVDFSPYNVKDNQK